MESKSQSKGIPFSYLPSNGMEATSTSTLSSKPEERHSIRRHTVHGPGSEGPALHSQVVSGRTSPSKTNNQSRRYKVNDIPSQTVFFTSQTPTNVNRRSSDLLSRSLPTTVLSNSFFGLRPPFAEPASISAPPSPPQRQQQQEPSSHNNINLFLSPSPPPPTTTTASYRLTSNPSRFRFSVSETGIDSSPRLETTTTKAVESNQAMGLYWKDRRSSQLTPTDSLGFSVSEATLLSGAKRTSDGNKKCPNSMKTKTSTLERNGEEHGSFDDHDENTNRRCSGFHQEGEQVDDENLPGVDIDNYSDLEPVEIDTEIREAEMCGEEGEQMTQTSNSMPARRIPCEREKLMNVFFPHSMDGGGENKQDHSLDSHTKPVPFRRQLSKRKSEVLLDLELDTVVEVEDCQETNGDDTMHINDDNLDHDFVDSKRNIPPSPRTPKTRKMHSSDPYQIFQVQNAPCLIFQVKVLRGRNITMGLQDYYDTPDPYIYLHMPTSPEGRKKTTIQSDNPNPVWNEEFTFYINFTQSNILEIRLMESNLIWFDQLIGSIYFDVCNITEMDKPQMETFVFNKVCEVDIEFLLYFDKNPTLRYSLCLSDREKEFQEARKRRVMKGLKSLLGNEDGAHNVNEVPTIAVIGSGGGFRAMTAYSGVFKALVETGILDCVSYAGGLSGSSWFLSTLYSHPKWPDLDMEDFLDELMNSVDKNLRRFFNPSTMYQYASLIVQKRREGQPVSLTDVFGHLVGETLLQGRMDVTLTDQREKIKDGKTPMPLYTCVHVKKDVPARSFQEWVEFSPYEIGLPKYGTFMDSSLFGSKFFMGKLVKQFNEQPLHFLQGIWGSAFCILFKRLFEDNRRIDPAEMIRQEMGKQLEEAQNDSSSDCSDSEDTLDSSTDSNDSLSEQEKSMESNGSVTRDDSVDSVCEESNAASVIKSFCLPDTDSAYDGEMEDGEDGDNDEVDNVPLPFSRMKRGSVEMMRQNKDSPDGLGMPKILKGIINRCPSEDQSEHLKKSVNFGQCPKRYAKPNDRRKAYAKSMSMRKSRGASKSYWRRMMKAVVNSENAIPFLNDRQGRAAVIHNFMRGLSLQQTYPLSPFTPVHERVKEGDEFDGIFEMHPTSVKHIYMVDAGLTFNSPYPLVLRPQREVDIILSFDFSARPSDNHQPFKELLLAEKWARLNRLPFPPIDMSEYEKEGMKELYVFKHPTDPHCPVVLHFVLINKTFKNYSKPGMPRQTKEEFDFANFDIFDDPEAPYSTFNFTYPNRSFQRLTKLTEFNTLLHVDDIKKVFKERIQSKRANPSRYNVAAPKETFLLSMKSVFEMRKKMHKFMKRLGSTIMNGSASPTYHTATPGVSPSENPFFAGFNREVSFGSSADSSVFQSLSPNSDKPEWNKLYSPNKDRKRHTSSQSKKSSTKWSQLSSPKSTRQLSSSGPSQTQEPTSQHNVHSNSSPRHDKQLKTTGNGETSSLSNESPEDSNDFSQRLSKMETSSNPDSDKIPSSSVIPKRKKKSPPNLFFANMSFLSNPSSPGTGSPNSVNYRRCSVTSVPKHDIHRVQSLKSGQRSDSPLIPEVLRLQKNNVPSKQNNSPLTNGALPVVGSTPTPLFQTVATAPVMDKTKPAVSTSHPGQTHTPTSKTQQMISQSSQEEDFTLAPEAFKSDGTPVFEEKESKMYYDQVKEKRRKMFRHQSTVSSLSCMSLDEIEEYYDCPSNQEVKNISESLDSGYNSIKFISSPQVNSRENNFLPDSTSSSLHSGGSVSGYHPGSVDFQDLNQFEANNHNSCGSADENVQQSSTDLKTDDSMADEEEWFDIPESMEDVSM